MARTPDSKPNANGPEADPAKTAEPGHTNNDAAAGGANAEPPADLEGKDGPGAHAVGYCRPPLQSRFKAGQSGNPKGREKQSLNGRTIMKQVLNEVMQIREGGRVRRVSTFEALVRTTLSRALKGDPKAVNSFLLLMRSLGYGSEHDEPAAELLSGTNLTAIINDYVDRNPPARLTASETKSAEETPSTERSMPPVSPPKKST